MPDKAELRRRARERRRMLPTADRRRADHAIARLLQTHLRMTGDQTIAAYASVASEADLSPWFARLDASTRLVLPAIDAVGCMTFRRWSPGEALMIGPHAIRQPGEHAAIVDATRLDVILLPLLAFDSRGTRLGSGAGYYDRALSFRREAGPLPRLVGIAYSAQQFDDLPRDPWDIPLDAVVTEQGWIDIEHTRDDGQPASS